MGLAGLPWMTQEYPFARGLNQKVDSRLIEAPELVRAVDVEFDDLGALRLRKPFLGLDDGIYPSGTIANCRRIVRNGDELLLFTKDTLYSWSSTFQSWVAKGTHLAVKVDEQPVFVTTGDQVQCDRAELTGTVAYAWTDLAAGSSTTGTVYYALVDKATGAVLVAPTAVTSATGRPRLVALTTVILLFYTTSTPTLLVRSITPGTGALSAATTVLGANVNGRYDVTQVLGANTAVFAAVRNPTTSYEVGTVTSALAVTQSTKGRTCDGAIAVSSSPTGTIQVIRGNGTNVQGDYLTSGLADTTINQAVGTITSGTVGQVTCAHRSTQDSSAYRCYAYWQDTDANGTLVKYNYVDTGGTLGTQATFVRELDLASRAFDYGGRIFVHLAYVGVSSFTSASSLFNGLRSPLQNTYFLYRDDAFLCAKLASTKASGEASATIGFLPGVALTSGTTTYSWCGGERRVVPFSTTGYGYGDHGPRDFTFTFDSNDARRCARIGQTLYIAAGEILAYDGTNLVECGFHVYPRKMGVTENASGSIAVNGDYAYCGSYRWDNAKGERDRSTTATSGSAPIASQPGSFDITGALPLYVTHKTNRPVAMEWWRTAIAPQADSPFYLVTGQSPTTVTGSNCYVVSDTSLGVLASFNDDFTDAVLTTKEVHPENEGVLENLAPPAASLIVANDTRVFLAGVAGDPHRVWYSKQREDGQVVSFHDALVVPIPEAGGDITGLAFLNETLVVFRETAIYALDGVGFDNTGGGQNFQARLVSSDCGAVNHESIVLAPTGLMFKSSKGWYLLNRGWADSYIGGNVADYDSESVYAAHVIETQHQVRIVTSGRVLVFDYLVGQWAEWSIAGAVHACVWNATYHYLTTADVKAEQTTWAQIDYGADVEMLIRTSGIQGFARVRKVMLLGEYRSACTVRVRVAYNFGSSYVDDKTWTATPTTVGGPLQLQHGPSRPQCEAISIRITSGSAGEQLKLSAIALEVATKPGVFRHQPAAQRQ